jgi:predicted DNA-binding ribbon-helix-helix protein
MSAVSLRLPDSLHQSVKKMALQEHVSVNQLITLAVAEKMSVLMTADYLAKRGQQSSKGRFLRVLGKAKNQEPLAADRRIPLSNAGL